MIDIEPMVFTAVYDAVTSVYPEAYLTPVAENIPAAFPCVSVSEVDNYTYVKSQDNDKAEHHANVTYEINIYSNQENTSKSQAKEIMSIVDKTMQNMRFTRQSMLSVPNVDRTKYRITARYRAIVARPIEVDGNNVYQMYRK